MGASELVSVGNDFVVVVLDPCVDLCNERLCCSLQSHMTLKRMDDEGEGEKKSRPVPDLYDEKDEIHEVVVHA